MKDLFFVNVEKVNILSQINITWWIALSVELLYKSNITWGRAVGPLHIVTPVIIDGTLWRVNGASDYLPKETVMWHWHVNQRLLISTSPH